MTRGCLTQIPFSTSPRQVAGRTYGQDAFYIPLTTPALYAETALTPQCVLTNNTFDKVVGQVHSLILYEYPKILLVFKYLMALIIQEELSKPP